MFEESQRQQNEESSHTIHKHITRSGLKQKKKKRKSREKNNIMWN